jgi:transposase
MTARAKVRNEKTIGRVPGLPEWELVCEDQNEHDICYTVIAPYKLSACPKCFSSAKFYLHGRCEQLFMDTPMLGKRLGVLVRRQRYRCEKCKGVFLQPLTEMDENRAATKRLITYIQKQAIKRTFSSVAEEVGLSEKTIRNIFYDYIKELDDQARWEGSMWIGIDEVKVGKSVVCVITDLKRRSLLDMLPNKKYNTLAECLITKADRFSIKAVCIDMCVPYRLAVRSYLPNAAIVSDKFHVLQLVNKALDQVRKNVARKMKLNRHQAIRLRKHVTRYMLATRHTLKKRGKDIRDAWLRSSEDLRIAYEFKEAFYDIYNVSNREEAERRYEAWKSRVLSNETPFTRVVNAIDRWHNEVFNYFDFPQVTNAYAEATNNIIKFRNLIGRGYSFEVLRAKCLYSEGHFKIKMPNYEKQLASRSRILGSMDHSIPLQSYDDYRQIVVVDVPLLTLIDELQNEDI